MNQHQQPPLHPDLHELDQMLQGQLQQALQYYQNLPEAELQKPGENNGWSIVQCLDHLNTYSRHYLPRIKTQLENYDDCHGISLKLGWLGKFLVNMIDPDRKAVKYKAMKKHLPNTGLAGHQVVAEFIDHQEQLIEFNKIAASKDKNRIRVQTSIHPLISLRLGDTLLFLAKHNERHIRQANRNLNRSPK